MRDCDSIPLSPILCLFQVAPDVLGLGLGFGLEVGVRVGFVAVSGLEVGLSSP